MNTVKDESYNGYSNWETWNACLWILNDEFLYRIARGCRDYHHFMHVLLGMNDEDNEHSIYLMTPDNLSWSDLEINHAEVDAAVWGDDGILVQHG